MNDDNDVGRCCFKRRSRQSFFDSSDLMIFLYVLKFSNNEHFFFWKKKRGYVYHARDRVLFFLFHLKGNGVLYPTFDRSQRTCKVTKMSTSHEPSSALICAHLACFFRKRLRHFPLCFLVRVPVHPSCYLFGLLFVFLFLSFALFFFCLAFHLYEAGKKRR